MAESSTWVPEDTVQGARRRQRTKSGEKGTLQICNGEVNENQWEPLCSRRLVDVFGEEWEQHHRGVTERRWLLFRVYVEVV